MGSHDRRTGYPTADHLVIDGVRMPSASASIPMPWSSMGRRRARHPVAGWAGGAAAGGRCAAGRDAAERVIGADGFFPRTKSAAGRGFFPS
jgi:hypothetical protein